MKVDRDKAIPKELAGETFYFCTQRRLSPSRPAPRSTPPGTHVEIASV